MLSTRLKVSANSVSSRSVINSNLFGVCRPNFARTIVYAVADGHQIPSSMAGAENAVGGSPILNRLSENRESIEIKNVKISPETMTRASKSVYPYMVKGIPSFFHELFRSLPNDLVMNLLRADVTKWAVTFNDVKVNDGLSSFDSITKHDWTIIVAGLIDALAKDRQTILRDGGDSLRGVQFLPIIKGLFKLLIQGGNIDTEDILWKKLVSITKSLEDTKASAAVCDMLMVLLSANEENQSAKRDLLDVLMCQKNWMLVSSVYRNLPEKLQTMEDSIRILKGRGRFNDAINFYRNNPQLDSSESINRLMIEICGDLYDPGAIDSILNNSQHRAQNEYSDFFNISVIKSLLICDFDDGARMAVNSWFAGSDSPNDAINAASDSLNIPPVLMIIHLFDSMVNTFGPKKESFYVKFVKDVLQPSGLFKPTFSFDHTERWSLGTIIENIDWRMNSVFIGRHGKYEGKPAEYLWKNGSSYEDLNNLVSLFEKYPDLMKEAAETHVKEFGIYLLLEKKEFMLFQRFFQAILSATMSRAFHPTWIDVAIDLGDVQLVKMLVNSWRGEKRYIAMNELSPIQGKLINFTQENSQDLTFCDLIVSELWRTYVLSSNRRGFSNSAEIEEGFELMLPLLMRQIEVMEEVTDQHQLSRMSFFRSKARSYRKLFTLSMKMKNTALSSLIIAKASDARIPLDGASLAGFISLLYSSDGREKAFEVYSSHSKDREFVEARFFIDVMRMATRNGDFSLAFTVLQDVEIRFHHYLSAFFYTSTITSLVNEASSVENAKENDDLKEKLNICRQIWSSIYVPNAYPKYYNGVSISTMLDLYGRFQLKDDLISLWNMHLERTLIRRKDGKSVEPKLRTSDFDVLNILSYWKALLELPQESKGIELVTESFKTLMEEFSKKSTNQGNNSSDEVIRDKEVKDEVLEAGKIDDNEIKENVITSKKTHQAGSSSIHSFKQNQRYWTVIESTVLERNDVSAEILNINLEMIDHCKSEIIEMRTSNFDTERNQSKHSEEDLLAIEP